MSATQDAIASPDATTTIPTSSAPSDPSHSSHIPGLMTVSEWEAEIAAKKVSSPPSTTKKRKAQDTTSSACAPRTPLPSKPRGDCAAKLNDLCQLHRLRANFEFAEGPPYAFSAVLSFEDGDRTVQTFDVEGTFGSKKAAKEKAAEKGLKWLETQTTPSKPSKASNMLPPAAEKIDMSENWVGVLHEFCQGTQREQPDYPIYELGNQRYGATCCILGSTYHDPNAAFASKKTAKTSAARAAVLALRESGILARPSVLSRPNVTSVPPITPAFAPVISSAPIMSSVPVVFAATKENAISVSSPSASTLVPPLCASLALTPPTYKYTQSSAHTPDFWDAAAYFENTVEPGLRGAVAKVERVYGKKNAKEQVAAQVLQLLESVRDERLAA